MEERKVPFFTRIKRAITNFDEYQNFAVERVSTSIKYIAKLVVILSIIISIVITYITYKEVRQFTELFKEQAPEFRFEENKLITETDNTIISDENNSIVIAFNPAEKVTGEKIIEILEDKLVLKYSGITEEISYEQIAKNYYLSSITKQSVIEYINSSQIVYIYILFLIITIIYSFIIYLVQILLDVLILALLGYLVSKIFKVNFRFKAIFNIATYSLTLSIILYTIYIVVNLFTGFDIRYFQLAYNSIGYIYLITAILIIKSDLIKRQIELMKIIEEQKKIQKEKQEEEPKKEEKEDKSKKDDKEEKEKKGEDGTEPEGSKA